MRVLKRQECRPEATPVASAAGRKGRAIVPSTQTPSFLTRVLATSLAVCVLTTGGVALADAAVPSTDAAVPSTDAAAVAVAPIPEPLRAPPGMLPGIDVSHWQGAIDWAAVASSGVRFAIAKATDGRQFVDETYLTNKAGAELNGIVFGAYHFARPDGSAGDAVAEADHFVDHAQLGGGNLIPVLDLERTGGLSDAEVTTWILTWLARVHERTGVRPMVYTSPSGWEERTGDTTAVADAGYTVLWVAHWNTDAPRVPAANWGGHGWTFWQTSSCGSVRGIAGCVDVDLLARESFAGLTFATPDVVAPTVTMDAPVGGPVTVSFSEPVRHVTSDNVYVWTPLTGTYPDVALTCRARAGVVVDCVTGRVRSVIVETVSPLVLGETYEAVVNPAVVTSGVVDRSGNPAPTTTTTLLAPTVADDLDDAVRLGWRSMTKTAALGGSYAFERSAGASASFAFEGTSVTWYTATGPTQGRASVFIDGERVRSVDGYATRTSFGVARRFTGLARGAHVIAVKTLGRGDRDARDSQVVVDAFGVNGVIVKSPVLDTTWRRVDGVSTTDVARASAEVTFSGTGIDWHTLAGPEQGSARLYIDGVLAETIDNGATAAAPIVRSVTGFAPGTHTLRLVVAGEGSVAVDGFTVRP